MNSKKIKELSDFATEASGNDNLARLISSEDISFPLAFSIEYGFATATDKGIQEMQTTYNYLVSLAKERSLKSIWDLLFVEEELPQRGMVIRIQETV